MTNAGMIRSSVLGLLVLLAVVSVGQQPAARIADPSPAEKQILARLKGIQEAAEALDADAVFRSVAENDQGCLVQNGRLLVTRKDALESTRRGFEGLQKVSYQMEKQHLSMLSPTIALVVSTGASSAVTRDGRTLETPFSQSVVLILTNGDWKVFHAHRSFAENR